MIDFDLSFVMDSKWKLCAPNAFSKEQFGGYRLLEISSEYLR